MKLWYIKALRAEKERQQENVGNIPIGHMVKWWEKDYRGTFNKELYFKISQIKAS